MDHSTHTELVDSDLTEENLLGALVYGSGGETIGTVSHVHGLGAATRVVVDVGGFLGIGTRPVALTTNQLNFMRDEDGIVHASTAWTKEHILELPEHRH